MELVGILEIGVLGLGGGGGVRFKYVPQTYFGPYLPSYARDISVGCTETRPKRNLGKARVPLFWHIAPKTLNPPFFWYPALARWDPVP